jgi:TetR/AcrR family transcriptional regulator, regulator of autoinduction and epiphytic fitness
VSREWVNTFDSAEADVAKGALYNHFLTKEAVLAGGIHDQLGRDLEPLMTQLPPDAGFSDGVRPFVLCRS